MFSVSGELARAQGVLQQGEREALTTEADRQKEALDRAHAKQVQHDEEDMRQALRVPNCRRILQRVVAECHPFSSSFSRDPLVMAAKEGERSIGLFLIDLIERADPGATLRMQREFISDKKVHDERMQKLSGGSDA
jgi:histone H3/H4